MFSLTTKLPSKQQGFTIIELMVTVGIFVFMTALILARYNSFYSGTLFTNQAYDIALTIKQAQTYGISVKVNNDPTLGNFKAAYGVHFDTGSNDNFILFADINSNKIYDGNGVGADADESKYFLKQGGRIKELCFGSSGSACDTVANAKVLDISFKRPEPMAIICAKDQNNVTSCANSYAEITLQSGDGTATKKIKVTGVGQISVTN